MFGILFYIANILTAILSFFGVKLAFKVLGFASFMGLFYYLFDFAYDNYFSSYFDDFSLLSNNARYLICKLKLIELLNFVMSSELALFFLRKSIYYWINK